MRTIRIYQAGEYSCGDTVELSNDAAQHVAIVLRMQVHNPLTLFNGKNAEFEAVITEVRKKTVFVNIKSAKKISRESNLTLHLGQALSKGDRMETVVQKAVELGVSSITPLITERCAVKLDATRLAKKMQQWQAIAVAACEQCGRNLIPIIHPPLRLAEFAQQQKEGINLMLSPHGALHWRAFGGQSFTTVNLVIGPEGGFSPVEEQLLVQHNFAALSLGLRILRTETAAITAISVLQAAYGDL